MSGTTQNADFESEQYETFCAESEERIESAITALLRLEKSGKNWHETSNAQKQFFQELKLLKESSQNSKLQDFQIVVALMETTLSPLKDKKGLTLSETDYQSLYEAIDLINELILLKAKDKGRKKLCNNIQKLLSDIKPIKHS